DTTINSLVFGNTNTFQNLQINPGRTLAITGVAPGYQNSPALSVGQEGGPATADRVRVTLRGSGTVAIDNTNAAVQVRHGSSTGNNGPLAILDMSGLDNFRAALRRVQL